MADADLALGAVAGIELETFSGSDAKSLMKKKIEASSEEAAPLMARAAIYIH